jgi:hypothetical protein
VNITSAAEVTSTHTADKSNSPNRKVPDESDGNGQQAIVGKSKLQRQQDEAKVEDQTNSLKGSAGDNNEAEEMKRKKWAGEDFVIPTEKLSKADPFWLEYVKEAGKATLALKDRSLTFIL